MREDFLHFIWQFQYFESDDLLTTHQERIQVLDPGFSQY